VSRVEADDHSDLLHPWRTRGSLPTGPKPGKAAEMVSDRTAAGLPDLDDQARDAYRRRLAEIDEDIEEATRMNDTGRLQLAQHDREYLIGELKRAVGLGGRHRTIGGTTERARTSVTRSLRYALGRLAEHHPSLAAHLEQSVHTGTYCPTSPTHWRRSVGSCDLENLVRVRETSRARLASPTRAAPHTRRRRSAIVGSIQRHRMVGPT
jgi:hypothetical protein